MPWILVQLTIEIMMLGDDEDDCCATVTSMMSMILVQLTIARTLEGNIHVDATRKDEPAITEN